MYISNLQIKNFRNFTDFDIDLHPFTLIIGENNTGKSNLLEAISLLLGQEITMYKKRVLEIDDINYQKISEFKSMIFDEQVPLENILFPYVKIELTLTDFNDDQEAVVGDWYVDRDLKYAKLTYLFSLREGWSKKNEWLVSQRNLAISGGKKEFVDFPIEQYEYSIYGGGNTHKRVDPYFLKMLKMENLDALRDAKKELVASGDYRLLFKVLNNRDKTKFALIQEKLLELEEKVKTDIEFGLIKSEIKTYLDKISLQEIDSDNNVDFKFSSPELNEILKKLSLVYGSDPIGVERNGLGRNNLLYISLVLSHLINKTDDNSTFFRFVGIEEPESHLHPHLQHHLSKNIRNDAREDLQIVLTTHSPYISSQLEMDHTYVLFKNEGVIKRHHLLKGIDKNSQTAKYLQKYLDASNSAMFFAKKLILVEGISEMLLLPTLFSIHSKGIPLEKIGCNVINVYGLAFSHFLEIINNGYFIRCSVFTDNDNNNRATELKNNYGSDVINVCISAESTFEKDLIEANNKGVYKKTLFEALCVTRPDLGKALKDSTKGDINVEEFYSKIKDYKSEFAFDLLSVINKQNVHIRIPQYLKEGFDHLLDPKIYAPNES